MAAMQRSLCSRSRMLSPQAEQKSPVTAGTTMDPSLYEREISRVSWMRPAAPQHGQFMVRFPINAGSFRLELEAQQVQRKCLALRLERKASHAEDGGNHGQGEDEVLGGHFG